MRVLLAVTSKTGKNVAFVTDSLEKFSLRDALVLVEKGRIEGIHRVNAGLGKYLRSNPNGNSRDNLDSRSISYSKLLRAKSDVSMIARIYAFQAYWKAYQAYLNSIRESEEVITVDGVLWTPKRVVVDEIKKHRKTILNVARAFNIDPNFLGAIIIDEYARFSGLDFLEDWTGLMNRDTTVGVAQVRLSTARGLIRDGYYNPNPDDPKLERDAVQSVPLSYLYKYVIEPQHSISFAAAHIKELIDRWMPVEDISRRPELIASLYSKKSNANLEVSTRGKQIVEEFYPLFQHISEQ